MIPAPQTLAFTGFKPTQPWPWHVARHEAVAKVRAFNLQPGMCVVRLGNATMRKKISFGDKAEQAVTELLEAASLAGPAEVYVELPFSPIIAKASGSKYSHAALVYDVGKPETGPRILDVGGEGTKVLDFVDWVDDVRGQEIEFLRIAHGRESSAVDQALNEIRYADPDFDPDFAPDVQKLYCLEAAYHFAHLLAAYLGPPTPFRELPGWTPALDAFAMLGDIDASASVFHVGSDGLHGKGLLASQLIESLGGLRLTKLPDSSPAIERW